MKHFELSTSGNSKKCTKCKAIKPLEEFPERMNNLDMRANQCCDCVSQRAKELKAAKDEQKKNQIRYF